MKHHKATHKGNTISDVNPPGTVNDGETATVKKDKKGPRSWGKRSAVVTFDLREGRSAIRPHQTAATTASAAAGRTRTNRSEVKNEAFVTSPFLISESRAQFINMSI